MYIDDSIPLSYNRIADINSNYVVLVRESSLNSGTDYDAYIQFFFPSTNYIHVDDYRIYDGVPTFDVNYNTNGQYFTYIDDIDTSYTKTTMELTDRTSDMWERADIGFIGLLVGLLLALTILIVNLATSLVHRGGIFHA